MSSPFLGLSFPTCNVRGGLEWILRGQRTWKSEGQEREGNGSEGQQRGEGQSEGGTARAALAGQGFRQGRVPGSRGFCVPFPTASNFGRMFQML